MSDDSSPSDPGDAGVKIDGADPATVRAALDTGDALSGTGGFAGLLDGTLLRDVLGRRPLFVERESDERSESDGSESDDTRLRWAFDPTELDEPEPLPAGHRLDGRGDSGDLSSRSERVWTLPDPEPLEVDAALERVERAVLDSTQAVTSEDLAVAFSGGVDSAVVASGVPDAPLYVAGFEGCHDVAAAREAATAMDRELRVVEIEHEDLTRAVPEIVAATGRRNPMDVTIALPLYLVAERVAADGYDRLALGQGADELFGGYAKVVEPHEDDRVDADTVRGARREIVQSLPAQLERDVLTLRAAGVEPVTPLLHDDVIAAALALPGEVIATPEERKIALRDAAAGVVPDSVRTADKKAVQYGTYVSRELDRLARQAGYKRRMDNHVGQYIEALLAGEVSPPEE